MRRRGSRVIWDGPHRVRSLGTRTRMGCLLDFHPRCSSGQLQRRHPSVRDALRLLSSAPFPHTTLEPPLHSPTQLQLFASPMLRGPHLARSPSPLHKLLPNDSAINKRILSHDVLCPAPFLSEGTSCAGKTPSPAFSFVLVPGPCSNLHCHPMPARVCCRMIWHDAQICSWCEKGWGMILGSLKREEYSLPSRPRVTPPIPGWRRTRTGPPPPPPR